ncbi:MAG: transposase [Candidatus Aureabacteria bacterium]|nr:transposase [Candidatus Auribacterota bacterium]
MSRPLRIEFPGAYYHILHKSNGNEKIFKGQEDCNIFFEYLHNTIIRYDIRLHCFVILPNAYHLLLETIDANLSRAMHYLSTGFSMKYNAAHRREGHVFRGRYKSTIIQPGDFLCYMSRKMHLEPLEKKLVTDPTEYPFSSYKYYVDDSSTFLGLTKDTVLSYFDKDLSSAAVLYKRFVEGSIGKKDLTFEKNLHGGIILGSNEFVEWMKKSFMEGKDSSEIPVLNKFKPPGPDPVRIKEIVEKEISNKRWARKIAIYLIRKYSQHKLKDIAKLFGKITDAGISQSFYRTEIEKNEKNELSENIQKIERLLKTLHII